MDKIIKKEIIRETSFGCSCNLVGIIAHKHSVKTIIVIIIIIIGEEGLIDEYSKVLVRCRKCVISFTHIKVTLTDFQNCHCDQDNTKKQPMLKKKVTSTEHQNGDIHYFREEIREWDPGGSVKCKIGYLFDGNVKTGKPQFSKDNRGTSKLMVGQLKGLASICPICYADGDGGHSERKRKPDVTAVQSQNNKKMKEEQARENRKNQFIAKVQLARGITATNVLPTKQDPDEIQLLKNKLLCQSRMIDELSEKVRRLEMRPSSHPVKDDTSKFALECQLDQERKYSARKEQMLRLDHERHVPTNHHIGLTK